MAVHPTGEQYEITSSAHRAVVTELGATLRTYQVGSAQVVRGFAVDQMPRSGRGQQLLPWPNRIRDGKYSFAGAEQQLPLTEPARHNASHGLVRWAVWEVGEHRSDTITQQVRVYPQPGWPGAIEAHLTHAVSADGLSVELEVRNIGSTPVPFGYGAHPYLTVGEATVDEVRLTVPADSFLEVDEQMLPVAVHPVTGSPYDLRAGAQVGDRRLDTAMTGLAKDRDGRWRVRLECADRWAELWAGPGFEWTQVFTGGPARDVGLAVEPMTCGPDAFNDGPTAENRLTLDPGESFSGRWGIRGG